MRVPRDKPATSRTEKMSGTVFHQFFFSLRPPAGSCLATLTFHTDQSVPHVFCDTVGSRIGLCPQNRGHTRWYDVMEPISITGLTANFSPIPRMATPTLEREIVGAEIWFVAEEESFPFPLSPLSSTTAASTEGSLRGRYADLIGSVCQQLFSRCT